MTRKLSIDSAVTTKASFLTPGSNAAHKQVTTITPNSAARCCNKAKLGSSGATEYSFEIKDGTKNAAKGGKWIISARTSQDIRSNISCFKRACFVEAIIQQVMKLVQSPVKILSTNCLTVGTKPLE